MKNKQQKIAGSLLSFEGRLNHARVVKQNILTMKWVLFAISITLLLVYFLTPIRDILFAS